MGFYFDFNKLSETEFNESKTPLVFWGLYLLLGLSLLGMGLSAHRIIGELYTHGTWLDRLVILIVPLISIPLYLLTGIRLIWVKKFLLLGSSLEVGYRIGTHSFLIHKVRKEEIESIELSPNLSSPNLAPLLQSDSEYFAKGHWQVLLRLKTGQLYRIDRHVERDALVELFETLNVWKGLGPHNLNSPTP